MVMPFELYTSAETDNVNDFISKAEKFSSDNVLQVATVLQNVTPYEDSFLHVAAAATDPVNSNHITTYLAAECPDLITKKNFHGDTPLHLAAKAGNLEATKALIHQAKNSNIPMLLELRNNKGNTALHEAAIHNHCEVIDCLVGEGNHQANSCNISGLLELQNKKGNTALHEAVIHHHIEAVGCLLKDHRSLLCTYQNREFKTPLYLAVETHDGERRGTCTSIIRCLLEVQPVDEASLTKLQKSSPAHAALELTNALSGDIISLMVKVKRQLLQVKDEKRELPLHCAARKGDAWIVEDLVEIFSDGVFQRNNEGLCPVHVACIAGQVHAVKLLLRKWPNPMHVVDANGKNILHIAAQEGNDKVVKTILQYVANHSEYKALVNTADLDGNTPLHLAAKNGCSKAVFRLVRNRLVCKCATNNENLTPYEIASKQSKQAEVQLYAEAEDWQEAPDDEGKNKHPPKATYKVDFYEAMMTLSILYYHAGPIVDSNKFTRIKFKPLLKEELNTRIQTLLVVAVLVAGVTFAGSLTVPKDHVTQGATVLSKQDSLLKQVFIFLDMVAFNSSVMAAIILCCAQLSDVKIANRWVLTASSLVGGSLYLMSLAFSFGLVIQVSTSLIFLVVVVSVHGLLFIFQTVAYIIPLFIFPKILERLVSPYVYHTMFLYNFLSDKFLEFLELCFFVIKSVIIECLLYMYLYILRQS